MEIGDFFNYVSDEFTREKVAFLLIGGFAVNLHKVSRNTDDVDFMIATDDYKKCSQILNKAGYSEFQKHDNFSRFRTSNESDMVVDLLFVDQDTMQLMLAESVSATIGGKNFRIPSVKHLIALKLHAIKNNQQGRLLNDLPDICRLIQQNHLSLQDREMKDLFLKYGNQDIYQSALYFLGKLNG